jgi:hypothetical protein
MFVGMKKAEAKVKLIRHNTTPCLVATFTASEPPAVWQFDLDKNHSFTLLLKEAEGLWALGFMEPGKSFIPVVRFASLDDAEAAYAAVQKALMKQQRLRRFRLWRWLFLVIAVLVLFVLSQSISVRFGTRKDALGTGTTSLQQGSAPAPLNPGEIQNGVPLSADDVLKAVQ